MSDTARFGSLVPVFVAGDDGDDSDLSTPTRVRSSLVDDEDGGADNGDQYALSTTTEFRLMNELQRALGSMESLDQELSKCKEEREALQQQLQATNARAQDANSRCDAAERELEQFKAAAARDREADQQQIHKLEAQIAAHQTLIEERANVLLQNQSDLQQRIGMIQEKEAQLAQVNAALMAALEQVTVLQEQQSSRESGAEEAPTTTGREKEVEALSEPITAVQCDAPTTSTTTTTPRSTTTGVVTDSSDASDNDNDNEHSSMVDAAELQALQKQLHSFTEERSIMFLNASLHDAEIASLREALYVAITTSIHRVRVQEWREYEG
jgi:DNA repair exonuclease SbcCD ATPase subunit